MKSISYLFLTKSLIFTIAKVFYSQSDERSGKVDWQQWATSSSFSLFPVPSEAPGSVAFTKRSKEQLTVSWRAPSRNSQNGELTGYRVCYSHKANSNNQSCSPKNAQSYTAQISDLRPATKYFVTVAARTAAGYGPKSEEINKITNGGKYRWE